MKLVWLLPDQPCDRHQFGDTAAGLWSLRHQGYPVAPTLLISVDWWQQYAAALAALPIAELTPGDPTTQTQLQQLCQRTVIPQAWLNALTTAGRNLPGAAVVLHLGLVTHDKLPLEVQDLWRSQTSLKTAAALVAALLRLWQQVSHVRSLYYYQQHQLAWSDLQIALRIQPLRAAIASGRWTHPPQAAQLEAIWGLGYGWLTDAIAPDYYASTTAAPSGLRPQRRGSKHQTWRLTPQSQLQQLTTAPERQGEWVFATPDLPRVFAPWQTATPVSGQFLWQQTARGQVEVTHWRALPTPSSTTATPATSATTSLSLDSDDLPRPTLTGQGVVPGSAVGPPVILTSRTQTVPPDAILVAPTLPPRHIGLLGEAAGLILEQGTATSHAVIVARELGIPTLIGVAGAIAQLQSAQTVCLEAEQGRVYCQSRPTSIATPVGPPHSLPEPPSEPLPASPSSRLPVWGTLNHPQALRSLPSQPLDGIGLIRAELLLMSLQPGWTVHSVPTPTQIQTQLEQTLGDIAASIMPRPLFYRFADWRTAEFPPLPGSTVAPADRLLGQRGLSAAQANPWLFDLELSALKTVLQQYPDLGVIFPFVRRLSEWVWARDRLLAQGVQPGQSWVMAETPAIAFEIEAYAEAGAQGVAIGLNDLTQLTLGIDREVSGLAQAEDWRHPAVQAAIGQIIQQSRQAGLPCSLCANLDWQQPALQTLLQQWLDGGLTAVVTELASLAAARRAIAQAENNL
ncbi:MAG: putative PEP-binding protein [Spirulinaceae cyanobacterium]